MCAKLILSEQEKQTINRSGAFIAIIMPGFIEDPSKYEACQYAEKQGKLLYAIIEDGIDWTKFKDFDWRKKYYTWIVTEALIEEVSAEIKKDISLYNTAGGK